MHPHRPSNSKPGDFGQVGAVVGDVSQAERGLAQDNKLKLLSPVLQDHMCTLLGDGIYCSLEVSADLERHDASIHHSESLYAVHP